MEILEHEFVPYHAERSLANGRALVLAPHPDDEVFGCGGAIMRHVEAGDPIRVVIVTDGTYGRASDAKDHADERQRESQHAASVLSCEEPVFWGLPDRGLEYGESLIGRILDAIQSWEAALVYAPSWWEVHPDHFVLALATAEAVRRCPRHIQLAMYEVGVPLHANRLLDITDLRERKQAAMACFKSQLAQQHYDRHVTALNSFRTYTLPADIRAAEAYRLLTAEALREAPLNAMRPTPSNSLRALAESLRGPTSLAADDDERHRLTAMIEALRRDIEAIHRSTSWRVTAPLRWLTLSLRRFAARIVAKKGHR